MKTNKKITLALTMALAMIVATEKVFAEEEQVIRVEIVQPEQTQQQKTQAYLDDLNKALDETARQSSIESQQWLDNRISDKRLARELRND